MATDLVAQKILNTDPQVGFGEGSVLPYRQHSLDTRGFEAMERAQARGEARKAARQKNNEDYYNTTIKDLPLYRRELDGLFGSWKNEVVDKTAQRVKSGVNASSDPNVIKDVLDYKQAVNNGNQLFKEFDSMDAAPTGKYVNKASWKGAAKKNLDERVERATEGDRSALNEGSIIPDQNDPEHFMFDMYLNDKYGKREDIVMSEDKITYGPTGERIVDKKTTAKFVTKDKNGKVVPGIDKSEIDNALYSETTDPDTIQFRTATFSLVDKQITQKALELKANDPRYKDIGTTQIAALISSNPRDPHYKDFSRNKIAEDLVRKKLEPFNSVSNETDISAGHKYDTDGDGAEAKKFRIEPTNIVRNTKNGLGVFAPGVSISKDGKPISLSVAPTRIHDFNKESLDFGNIDQVPVSVTGVGYTLTNKDGSLVSFKDNASLIKYIDTAKKEDLNKLKLSHVLFGTIEEKKTVSGDTGEDEPGDTLEQTANRSVAIDYDPNGETGAMLNTISGGKFKDRTLTTDEQAVKDAWDKRMTKKAVKPKTITQGGHTYTWDEKTQTYK